MPRTDHSSPPGRLFSTPRCMRPGQKSRHLRQGKRALMKMTAVAREPGRKRDARADDVQTARLAYRRLLLQY
jgi:hypothetical protein